MIIVDTNVILDIATRDPVWAPWSLRMLRAASLQDTLFFNGVIYAEMTLRYTRKADADRFMERAGLKFADMRRSAYFLAGKAFGKYREGGGPRENILPDFFIGAHAADIGAALITRDLRRYRTYFPDVPLIAPTLS